MFWSTSFKTSLKQVPRCYSQTKLLFTTNLSRLVPAPRNLSLLATTKPTIFRFVLRGGSTPNKITWVQQRQDHRGHESARERVLSLALSKGNFSNVAGKQDSTLDVNTNVLNNVFLYKYDKPKLFTFFKITSYLQVIFWIGLSSVFYKELTTPEPDEPWSAWAWKNYFKIVFISTLWLLGIGGTLLMWAFAARSIRYIILNKGGEKVTLVTYHPLSSKSTITVPVSNIQCRTARMEMRNYIPMKIKGRRFFYIIDAHGVFTNPTLFDYTVGALKHAR